MAIVGRNRNNVLVGASGGSPWLTAVDRKMLRPFGARRGGIYSVELG